MRRSRVFAITIIMISFLVSTGCQYDKVVKSDDFDWKYEMAKKYYNEGDYARSLPLLNQLLAVKVGTPEEKEIRYYMAYCYYGQGDFFSAASYFKQVFLLYPQSSEAEETLFMSAKAMYDASPRYELDQSYTYRALDAFQYFVDVYPKSPLVAQANDLMDEMRKKLEKKMRSNADLYYNTGNYQAAAVTYKNMLLDFPDTHDAEEISFRILSSYFNFAGQSIICRKAERYDMAIASYEDFIRQYPESKKADQAKSFYERSIALKQSALDEINTYKYKCDEYTEKN
ncbi:MAG: outer membrane protein assembly factor BamD [Chitinophagales bacterium]